MSNITAFLNEFKLILKDILGIGASFIRIPLHLLRAFERAITAILVKLHIVSPTITITLPVPVATVAPGAPLQPANPAVAALIPSTVPVLTEEPVEPATVSVTPSA